MRNVFVFALLIASALVSAVLGQALPYVAPETVVVPSGKLRLRGYLWKPPGTAPSPAVLFSHGSGDAVRVVETTRRNPGRAAVVTGTVFLERGLGGAATVLLGAIGFVLSVGRYDVGGYLWLEGLFVFGTILLAFVFFARSARPLLGPLTVSGVSPEIARMLAAAARKTGHTLIAVPAGPLGSFAPQQLRPGAAVSIAARRRTVSSE